MKKNVLDKDAKLNSNSPQEEHGSYIEQRVSEWKKRKNKENIGLKMEASEQGEPRRLNLKPTVDNTLDLTHNEKVEVISSLLSKISGSGNDNYNSLFMAEYTATMITGSEQDKDLAINAFIEAMVSMAPNDIIESQICAKLIVLASKSMHFMTKALSAEYSPIIDKNINRATKLMRLYNETLDALNRYRRKGEQRVTVQHVYVNKGGQAVVANEFTPGRGNKKKAKV